MLRLHTALVICLSSLYDLQVVPELMSVWSPPVTTPVMLKMSCTRGAISTSAVVLLSGMREEVFALRFF